MQHLLGIASLQSATAIVALVLGFALSKLANPLKKAMGAASDKIDALRNPSERKFIRGGINALFDEAEKCRQQIEAAAVKLGIPTSTVHEAVGMILAAAQASGLVGAGLPVPIPVPTKEPVHLPPVTAAPAAAVPPPIDPLNSDAIPAQI